MKARRQASARELATDVLVRVEQEQAYSNLLLNQALQKAELPRVEAGLATELVYGTIQRLNTIDYFLTRFVAKGVHKLEPWVRSLLRLSFYQLYYLDRIPAHAVVNEAVNIASRRGHKGISGMVNAVLRSIVRQGEQLELPADLPADQSIALSCSHPEWMIRRWIDRFGEAETRAICASNNEPPHISIRVNRMRTTADALLQQFNECGLSAKQSMLAPDGIVAEGGGNMALTSWYEEGLISIQDESSMLVAEMIDARPGMKVLDCCAAPGGKTTHIAERMSDRGAIIAYDIHEHKKRLIEAQAERLGLRCIQAMVGDARQLAGQLDDNCFDRILLDAPCSGLGVIRRKPEVKWTKSEDDISKICIIQNTILSTTPRLLKPGGLLIYSTCTLEYEENQGAVGRFLAENREFSLDPSAVERLPALVSRFIGQGLLQILPHQYQSDGFFIACLRKQAL